MIEKYDSKWVSLATVSILGQPPRRASAGLAGLIQASATTQMATYRLTIPVNTMLTEY
ncbi:MAG: hypothetical protein V3V31_09710 [Methylococcales bacterium]